MNTKRYRAATMREALELVKVELGEEALVLGTKRVRAGGFLGIGSREQIEVRVAADLLPSGEKSSNQRQTRAANRHSMLHLTDDTPAMPTPPARGGSGEANNARQSARGGSSAFAALMARAYSDGKTEETADAAERPATEDATRGIEIADTAPRIVHRNRMEPAPPIAATSAVSPTTAAASQPTAQSAAARPVPQALNYELEGLRAELREVKFSLGALAARPTAASGAARKAAEAFDETPELYDSPYFDAYIELAGQGLTPELARHAICAGIKARRQESSDVYAANGGDETRPRAKGFADGEKRGTQEVALDGLKRLLASAVRFSDDPLAGASDRADAPTIITLVGPTGVGKTTTIAKLAARVALREKRRVELVTLDTYRIAAVEQLRTYAEIIGAGFHIARSMVELDAITRRLEATATVLVDTVGRNPHDLADQLEFGDYLRAREDMVKCLVLQATTHPADALAAIRKFALYGADRLVITKLDETTAPGRVVALANESKLPLLYLCAGQRVPEDMERATPDALAARVVRAGHVANSV